MAFYRCGGDSKPTTLIDGVETEQDIKLKSLGISFEQELPFSIYGETIELDSKCIAYRSGYWYCFTSRYAYRYKDSGWIQCCSVPTEFNIKSNVVSSGAYVYFFCEISTAGTWDTKSTYYLYKFDGSSFTLLHTFSNLFDANGQSGTILIDKDNSKLIHIIFGKFASGGNISGIKPYLAKEWIYDVSNDTLTDAGNIPTDIDSLGAVYYNGEIHVIGDGPYSTSPYKHCKKVGTSWITLDTPPNYVPYQNIVSDDKYIYMDNRTYMYRFDGSVWTQVNIHSDIQVNRQFFCIRNSKGITIYSFRRISDDPEPTNTYYPSDEGRLYRMIENVFEIV